MRKRCAYTLVEVLLAVSLAAGVVGGALALAVRAADLWQSTAERLEVERAGQIVLDQLESDLQGWVAFNDSRVGLSAEIQADQPVTGGHSGMLNEQWSPVIGAVGKPHAADGSLRLEPELAQCRFGQSGVWLRFFASTGATSSEGSGAVAVSYQLVRRLPEGRAPVYQLFRSVVPASVCFERGYTLDGSPPYGAPEDGVEDLRRPRPDAVLAENVLDFGFRLLVETGTAAPSILFPDEGVLRFEASSAAPHPSHAVVFVRIATRGGARRLQRIESVPGAGAAWWPVAEAGSRVFTRRIRLPESGP